MELPLQPITKDDNGVLRFRENKIVSFLLKTSRYDLNQLICMPFTAEDWEQFSQLTGYSVSGFADLSYVRDATFDRVEQAVEDFKKSCKS